MKTKEKAKPKVEPTKTFVKRAMWTEKPRKMDILVCVCGNKYIKTRKDQVVCIWCIYKKVDNKK